MSADMDNLIERLTKPHSQVHRSTKVRVEKSSPSIQHEAAAAIRALLDRITSLESERDDVRRQRDEIGRAWDEADARAKEAEARTTSMEKALAEAREALEPFAELGADEGHEDHPDDTPAVIKIGRVTDFSMHLSDFRGAFFCGGRPMARPRLGEDIAERFQLVITREELQAIEDWRFANRVASNSEAIRRLVKLGMAAPTNTGEKP